MKNFIEKHPFWFSLGFVVVVMEILAIVVVVLGRVLGLPDLPIRIGAVLVTTIVPLVFIWGLGWWEDSGLGSTTQNLYALAVPVILMFFPLVFFGTIELEPARANIFLLAVFFTGISEEVVYRGLFIRAFLPHGKWKAVLIPAVVFALAHITNLLDGGMSLEDNLVQMALALSLGILYGAVRLRINSIWPLIITHTIWDLFWTTSGLGDGVYVLSDIPLSLNLVVWVPSIIAAVYLMRKPVVATIDGKPVE